MSGLILWQIRNSQEITERISTWGKRGNDESVLNELMKQSELQRGREKTREAGAAERDQSTIFEGEREER